MFKLTDDGQFIGSFEDSQTASAEMQAHVAELEAQNEGLEVLAIDLFFAIYRCKQGVFEVKITEYTHNKRYPKGI